MGDEKDLSATTASEAPPAVAPPAPVSVPPRPVSIPPRPGGGGPSRMPPAPSSRGIAPLTASPGAFRSAPPPPPVRSPAPAPVAGPAVAPAAAAAPAAPPALSSAVAASPSVMPRAPATPPPPPHRSPSSPMLARPSLPAVGGSATAQLEQRLGAAQVELRKLGSERHTLRARLRREADRVHEVESALRAEKELRRQASDEHFAALAGVRQRLSEVEAARDAELSRLRAEVEQARQSLTAAEARVVSAAPAVTEVSAARAAKQVQGLRRIRGIGPGYQRLLEQLGVTRVQQVATWSAADVTSFAEKLRIKPERIKKDDWVGQAQALEPDPEE